MKKLVVLVFVVNWLGFSMFAQTNSQLPVKGTIDIKFNSRQNPTPVKGVKDIYIMNINVANSVLFQGTIEDTPQIIDGWVSKKVVQPRSLKYDISCDVINPRYMSQTKNVGKLSGNVPINSDGVYQYDQGTLEIAVLPIGNASGFASKFGGSTLGKPLIRPSNWLDTLKRDVVNITRNINGKNVVISLKKYDKMEFRQHVIAAGPVQIYQPVSVNGEMLYDYDKECWFFNNMTIQYADNNVIKIDRLSGTIRWNKKQNEYQFDIRINEPLSVATEVFDTKNTDESSFFETDTALSSLTGTMLYKDSKRGDTTMSSMVTVDLTGNKLTKQQVMYICKVIMFSSVVPMNSD